DGADGKLEREARPLSAERQAALLDERPGRRDRGMAGHRDLLGRREVAGAEVGHGRAQDERGLGQVHLARDREHRRGVEVVGVEDDGARVAFERPAREGVDLQQAVLLHAASWAAGARSAWSRSAMRSAVDSIPTDSRMSRSEMPTFSRSSGESDACEVTAGRVTSVSTPPRLTVKSGSFSRRMKASASCGVPSISKLSMPPKPRKSERARACWGWLSTPGELTLAPRRCFASQRAISSAERFCASTRRQSVLSPRWRRKHTLGSADPPRWLSVRRTRSTMSAPPTTAPATRSLW